MAPRSGAGFASVTRMKQGPALGALFALLALAFAGVAFAAGNRAGGETGRRVVTPATLVLLSLLAAGLWATLHAIL